MAALAAGLDTLGGLLALVHLGLLIGAPLALVLHHRLRSIPVTVVLAVALSLALSALAAQSLIWFDAATDVLVVITATAYGGTLAYLLAESVTSEFERG